MIRLRRRAYALHRRAERDAGTKFSHDDSNVYVDGSRADQVAVARVAHRVALGHRVPVLQ